MEKTITIKGTNKEIIEILDKFTITDVKYTEVEKVCCKKKMIFLGDVNNTGMTQDTINMWVCGGCGSIREERETYYDDEELWNLLSNYQEEMKDTKILKELKKGDFE